MQSMIPKREIGALEFLKDAPEYDGRGVVIAIWDTGVDPTARGLQITSEGKPKIIDCIDASGSGDVSMLETFKLTNSSRTITTLTGRVVSIPLSWKPVDGLIRVGAKSAMDIFPSALLDQLRQNAIDRNWSPMLQGLSDCLKESVGSSPTSNSASMNLTVDKDLMDECEPEVALSYVKGKDLADGNGASSSNSFVSCKEEAEKQEEESREESKTKNLPISPGVVPNFSSFQEWLNSTNKTQSSKPLKAMERVLTMLNNHQKFYAPVFDCFVFKAEDGDFVACVDTSAYEETPTTLADMPLLKDFSIDRQVAHFGNDTLLYFTVKILNEGSLIQIVTNCGSHGTHVAAIASAYFSPLGDGNCNHDDGPQCAHLLEDGNQNGVAPGAQIISIKIADTHLGNMETNTAIYCALNWTTKLKCDLINYSFGEKAFLPNFGRIYTHLTQFVMHTDTAFITSGGNNGPSLGTMGSPGGSVDGLIGVAPLLFPEMMEYMYCQPTWDRRRNNGNTTIPPASHALVAHSDTDQIDIPENRNCPLPSAYIWGSRGPAADGDLGPTVAACGAAVADVAAWNCSAFDLFNGSSMSSPSVAGGFALILSALRQSESQPGLRVPFILWRAAIFACAKLLPHLSPLDQGAGLFQVRATYEFLRDLIRLKLPAAPLLSVNKVQSIRSSATELTLVKSDDSLGRFRGWWIKCRVVGPGCVADNSMGVYSRGIWLRHGWLPFQHCSSNNTAQIMSYVVHLEPRFCRTVSAEFRRNFSLNLSVKVGYEQDNTNDDNQKRPDWLCVSPLVMMSSRGRNLPLFIDPAAFGTASAEALEFNPPSQVYHTRVAFFNVDSPLQEVLAYLPITIQLPAVTRFDVDGGFYSFGLCGDFSYSQKVCRWFVRIPRNSTAAVLRLRRVDTDGDIACKFTVSVLQPAPLGSVLGTGYEVIHRHVNLVSRVDGGLDLIERKSSPSTSDAISFAFTVEWSCDCLEITVAQHHGADTPAACRIIGRLEFYGLEIRPERLIFNTSQTYFPISLRSNFGQEGVKFELESKHWIQPVRPTSSTRSYRKLVAFEKGFLGLPGVHSLQLVYSFVCPFKTDGAVFDFRRLTSLLYEADVVQIVYHVYDGCGIFKGAGSYQFVSNPRYRFKLIKGPHQLIATILYANTKKISYTAKEADALDKLAHYPLLIRWPLVASNTASTASDKSNHTEGSTSSQLTLEVSTSLANLALADVNYERTCTRFIYHSGDGTQAGGSSDQTAYSNSPKKDPVFGPLQRFPTVPFRLDVGECVTQVFGVVEENYAPYVTPGSYFEGRVTYYENRDIRNVVKLPLEVHVSSRSNAVSATATKPPVSRGAFGLCARDVWQLRWIANAHLDMDSSSNLWVSPYEVNGSSKSASPKGSKKKNAQNTNGGDKNQKGNLSHHVAALLNAGRDATTTDRAAVWRAVNGAMTDLVSASSTKVPYSPLTYLLPSPLPEVEKRDEDDSHGDYDDIGIIPLFVNTSPALTLKAVLAVQDPPPTTEATGENEKCPEKLLTRAQVVEVLCVYGRCLCEKIVLRRLSGYALAALNLVMTRLQQLLSPSSTKEVTVLFLRNLFNGDDCKVATATALSAADVERIRPVFSGFWLAQLFVLHPQIPLLDALMCLAFQTDSPTGMGGQSATTSRTKPSDSWCETVRMDGAAIAFPWMLKQLKRMGLSSVARQLERQMPSRFPAFDYTLMISRPLTTLPQPPNPQQMCD